MTESRDALRAQALKEKIGQLVSNYEDNIADLRAQSTIIISELQETNRAHEEKISGLEYYIEELKAKIEVAQEATEQPDHAQA